MEDNKEIFVLTQMSEFTPSNDLNKKTDIIALQDGNNVRIDSEVLSQQIINKINPKFVERKEKGQPNGVATLDENGKVPSVQLPPLDFTVNEIPIDKQTPTPTQNGVFIPTQTGTYPNFGGLEYTQQEFDNQDDVRFIFIDGRFEKQVKKSTTTDIVEKDNTNAISSKGVYDWSTRNVSTIEELRTIKGEIGQKINLLGYYTAGDKPSLLYKWIEGEAEDDGGSVIKVGKGYWSALFINLIDSRDFGIKNGENIDYFFNFINESSIRNVNVHNGNYISNKINITTNDVLYNFNSSEIVNNTTEQNESSFDIEGNNNIIKNLVISSDYRKNRLFDVKGSGNKILNSKFYFKEKSTKKITEIEYHKFGVALRGNDNEMSSCLIYNIQGAGLYMYGSGTKVIDSEIRDNHTGIVTQKSSYDVSILHNKIHHNDVNNAEGHSGIMGWSDKFRVIGNDIYNNGEHGTYIRGKDVIISENRVFNNYFDGIKVREIFYFKILKNDTYSNNIANIPSEGGVLVQEPFSDGDISGNFESVPNNGLFLRATMKKPTKNLKVSDNNGIKGILVHCSNNVTISNNNIEENISVGFDEGVYTEMSNINVKNNKCSEMSFFRCKKPKVIGNTVDSIFFNGEIECIFTNNTVKNQNRILQLRGIKRMSENDITYNGTTYMLQSLHNKVDNLIFNGNIFKSENGNFLYTTSKEKSGNNYIIEGNTFKCKDNPLYMWGDNHLIVGNNSYKNIGYFGISKSVIKDNIGKPIFNVDATENIAYDNIGQTYTHAPTFAPNYSQNTAFGEASIIKKGNEVFYKMFANKSTNVEVGDTVFTLQPELRPKSPEFIVGHGGNGAMVVWLMIEPTTGAVKVQEFPTGASNTVVSAIVMSGSFFIR